MKSEWRGNLFCSRIVRVLLVRHVLLCRLFEIYWAETNYFVDRATGIWIPDAEERVILYEGMKKCVPLSCFSPFSIGSSLPPLLLVDY